MQAAHSKWRRPARSGLGFCASSSLQRLDELARGAARGSAGTLASAIAPATRMSVVESSVSESLRSVGRGRNARLDLGVRRGVDGIRLPTIRAGRACSARPAAEAPSGAAGAGAWVEAAGNRSRTRHSAGETRTVRSLARGRTLSGTGGGSPAGAARSGLPAGGPRRVRCSDGGLPGALGGRWRRANLGRRGQIQRVRPRSFAGASGSFADGGACLAFSGAAASAGESSAPEGAGGGAEREPGGEDSACCCGDWVRRP